jgi:hypothetical protein
MGIIARYFYHRETAMSTLAERPKTAGKSLRLRLLDLQQVFYFTLRVK